ncbi:transcriptional regulator, padr family, putative [Heliomicrobium modesticaldum Ice1]|uniref:Transcriptional regulator, padr family, putative n=2 Tax=Heliomicrobium modesticaldum TaxID=35701 RepID=B0TAS3_HELMI|nr:transcriptional regulator, padr family, putative [Heliomicrobium modesticaldum Ice1]
MGGGRSDSLVFPGVLLSLRQRPAHGYELMEKLEQMHFVSALPDPAVIYRYLRRLEEEGMVESRLEPGQGGPARKVYSLTAEGESYLQAWVIRIGKQKNDLEAFLQAAERAAGAPGSAGGESAAPSAGESAAKGTSESGGGDADRRSTGQADGGSAGDSQ